MPEPDIQDSDSIVGKEITDSDVPGGNDVEGAFDGLRTQTLIFLEGQFKGQANEPLVNKLKTTTADERSSLETTEIRLKAAAGCGHILHTSAEAGVACLSCGRLGKEPLLLCAECAKSHENVCYICNAAACYRCRRERRLTIDGEKRVVCEACIKSTLRIRLLKEIIKWLFIAGALYYVVKF
jgi:hypothetical protein